MTTQGIPHRASPLVAGVPALSDASGSWSRAELDAQAGRLAQQLAARGTRVLATLMDNTAAWVIADLATEAAGVVHVPLPLFFTPAQRAHALAAAGVDTLMLSASMAAHLSDTPVSVTPSCTMGDEAMVLHTVGAAGRVPLPDGTALVTFTSGTTGTPKGVCLRREALQKVAEGVAQALAPLQVQRHLCALPLAVLLENIAGLRAPLSAGTTCVVLPLATLGWQGSSSFDAARFDAVVRQHAVHSLILLPQMLRAWVAHLRRTGQSASTALRFVAVGGAAVGVALIEQARAVGIPAAEGYGLSEGGSVQTLNHPGADRPGSVGRALPHAQVRIAADGEIEVAGSLFSGYLGAKSDAQPLSLWWPTGDLGRIDDDGFLYVHGRKKDVLITAFGRNVSPEWVEAALRAEPVIGQAVVFGDGRAQLGTVVWPAHADVDPALIDAAVLRTNAGLPDYARLGRWVAARAPFDAASGLATANGRPRRAEIETRHADLLYDETISET